MANYNVQTTASEGMSAELMKFYDKQLIENAKPVLVYNQFGQKRNIPKNNGKTISFRRFASLADPTNGGKLVEGITPDGQSLSVSEVTATVEQYGNYITTSDVLNLTSPDPVVTETNKLLGVQAGKILDKLTAHKICTEGTTVQFAGGATGTADVGKEDKLTVDEIKKAVATLKANNAQPIDGSFVAIIHPHATYDLVSDPEWTSVKNYDPKDLYAGEIGELYGVRFVESSEAYIKKGAGVSGGDVYCTVIVGANAYGVTEVEGGGLKMIAKSLGSAGTADPLDQRSTQGWKAMHVAEVLADEYMVRIESGATLAK